MERCRVKMQNFWSGSCSCAFCPAGPPPTALSGLHNIGSLELSVCWTRIARRRPPPTVGPTSHRLASVFAAPGRVRRPDHPMLPRNRGLRGTQRRGGDGGRRQPSSKPSRPPLSPCGRREPHPRFSVRSTSVLQLGCLQRIGALRRDPEATPALIKPRRGESCEWPAS